MPSPPPKTLIYSVGTLNALAKSTLEKNMSSVWVEGEISNFIAHTSGHFYFSLKDKQAQIRCVMFRFKNTMLNLKPKDGMQVLIYGRPTLYPERGTFQIMVENLEATGHGALQRAFEALKKKLRQAGWFDAIHKKPLPTLPKRIGVITSPTGAAIRDVLTVLERRAPMIEVVIYPSLVQGDAAAPQLIQALEIANASHECDVLLLVRGGGSIEDLWPFNEESVAKAIFSSKIPVVSGIGHEIDFTIADFVADHRSPTPSAAAESVTPDQDELYRRLNELRHRLFHLTDQQLKEKETQLLHLQQRLKDPRTYLNENDKQLSALKRRLFYLFDQQIKNKETQLLYLQQRLKTPHDNLNKRIQNLDHLRQRLDKALSHHITQFQFRLSHLAKLLEVVSPFHILARGYAVITQLLSGKLVSHAKAVSIGDIIKVKFEKDYLLCKVEKIESDP